MQSSRQLVIKDEKTDKTAVVYIMSRDQRVQDNHALLAAQAIALKNNSVLYVLFVLKKVETRSREHYEFMLEGLKEVSKSLSALNIPFVLKSGDAAKEIPAFAKEVEAGMLIFDFSPLKGARALVKKTAKDFTGSVITVDTHNIIPAWVVSDKQEFAAHTMRNKVHKKLEKFLIKPDSVKKQTASTKSISSLSFEDASRYIQSVPQSDITIDFKSGEKAAHSHLKNFLKDDLKYYAKSRNDIAEDHQSGLSPYLHFGQISSLRVALEVINTVDEVPLLLRRSKLAEHSDTPNKADGMNALLEEMVVRKELSDNFCLFGKDYLSITSAPEWAQKTLEEHANDPRDFTYNKKQWEEAKTHDEAWNVAQRELTKTGKIHGYMRMYWAKKLLEWSKSPEEALKTAIYLNDKYSIDGGDPNGYVGVLWSIAGLHDRPWFERSVYGKIRYMNESGLRRKFSVDDYIKRINSL